LLRISAGRSLFAGATVSDTLPAVIDPFFDRLTTDAQFEAALAVVERSRRGST